ncbi:ataxin-7-like isoform X2 [Ornithodoros turicata]|uniref:ataxin-7-like isoform X2 n=1 Tax=Ornithodoros turicata TaxID=34597 RepID=UPI003138D30F
MAAPDNVSVSDGQSWNSWAEAVGLRGPEKEDTETEAAKRESDAMKLRKEDMELFGLCPAWDDFYLVVCEICNQVTKPQAFRNHLEQRHGSNAFSRSDRADPSLLHSSSNKPSSSSSTSSSRPHAVSRNPSSSATGSGSGSRPPSSSVDKIRRNHHHPSLSPVVRVERMLLQGKPLPGERKELPSPQQPPPITPGGAGLLTGPGPGGGNRKSGGGQQRERKLLLCKDREYDPNKHCGVLVGDSGKPCTRSLTCKTHSLSLRRAVPGRRKNFDDLLMDHRAAKEASLASASVAKTPSPSSTSSASPAAAPGQAKHSASSLSEGAGCKGSTNLSHKFPNLAACKVSKTSPTLAQKSAKSCKPHTTMPSSCGGSGAAPTASTSAASTSCAPNPVPSATTERRRPDHSNDPYVQHHPKPVAICTFGLRQLGNGLFLLDRRWDCARSALRLALGSERSAHPPPLKKLCVESRLPEVPEAEDPLDPYSFSCAATSSAENAALRNSSASSSSSSAVALPSPQCVTSHHQPSSSAATKNASKTTSKQPHRTKVHHHHPVSNGGLSSHPISGKKKKVSCGTAPTTPTTTTTAAAVVPAAPITLSAAPISFPFRIGDQMGALSRLQVAGRNVSDGAVVVTGDVLNGQVNSVHSVTISRPGTGLGLATLVGQLQCRTDDKGKVAKGGKKVAPSSGRVVERTTGGVGAKNHHHVTLAASELSNMKVPHMNVSSLPNGLLNSGANRSSSEHPSTPVSRGPKNGSKPPSNKTISADVGAKPPLAAYQQVFTNQVQAQLVQIQAPGSIKYPILLPSDERRPRTQQLKVPGGSLPT